MKKVNLLCPSIKQLPGSILYEQKRTIDKALQDLKSISLKRIGGVPHEECQYTGLTGLQTSKKALKAQPSVQNIAGDVHITGTRKDELRAPLKKATKSNEKDQRLEGLEQNAKITLLSNNAMSQSDTFVDNQNLSLVQKEPSIALASTSDVQSISIVDLSNFNTKCDLQKQSQGVFGPFNNICSANNSLNQHQFLVQGNNLKNVNKLPIQSDFETSKKIDNLDPKASNPILEVNNNINIQKNAQIASFNKTQPNAAGQSKVVTEIHHCSDNNERKLTEKEYNEEILRMTHNLLDMQAPRVSLETCDGPLEQEDSHQLIQHQPSIHNANLGSTPGPILVAPGSRISHLTVKTFKKLNETESSVLNKLGQTQDITGAQPINNIQKEVELVVESKEKLKKDQTNI